MYKDSVRTSKRTQPVTITKINCLMPFKEIISVYTENHTKPININCRATDCQSIWYMYLPFINCRVIDGQSSWYIVTIRLLNVNQLIFVMVTRCIFAVGIVITSHIVHVTTPPLLFSLSFGFEGFKVACSSCLQSACHDTNCKSVGTLTLNPSRPRWSSS
jgi:hypothetical protein